MAKDVITRFKLETTGFDSKIKQAAKDLSAYSKTATQAKEGFNQFTKANVDAAKALGTMATSTTNVKDRVKELVGAYNDAAKAYEALSDEQKQSDWAKALAGSLTQLQQRIKETKQEMQWLGDGMKGGGFSGVMGNMSKVFGVSPAMLTGIGAAAAAFTGLKEVIGGNISTAIGFEKSMSQLSSLTGMVGKDLEKLKEYAIDLGSTSTLTASQVADAFRLIGSQQPQLLSSGEALKEVTKYAITLSEAAGIDLQTAAQTLSTSINQMGGDSNNAARYVNVLAAASQKGAGDIAWLGEAITKSATAAKAVGTDYEELVANLEQLAKAGFDASTAGTALRSIIMNLEKQANQDFKPSIVGLTQAFENLGKANLDIVGYQQIAGKMFASQAMALANASQEAKKMTGAITGTNIAEAQAKTNTDNLDGALKSLASAWEGLNLHINSSNGLLKAFVDWCTNVIRDLDNMTTSAGRAKKALQELNGGGNGQPSKVDRQISGLMGSNFKQQKYNSTLGQYDQDIKVAEYYKKKYKEAGWAGGSVLSDITRRFGVNMHGEEDIDNLINNLKTLREDYKRRAEKLLNPTAEDDNGKGKGGVVLDVDVDADTEKATKSIKELQGEIKKLKKLRDDAANAGNTKLRDQYNTQIKSVQAQIKAMRGGSIDTKKLDEIQKIQKKINDLTKEAYTADSKRVEGIKVQIAELQKEEKRLENIKNLVTGKSTQMTVGLSGFNEQTISAWTSMMKSEISKVDFGSDLYNSLTQNVSDMSTLTTAVQDAMKLGLKIPQEDVQEMFEAIFDRGTLPDDLYAGMIQKFIDEFKERTGKDLQVGENGSLSTGTDKGKDKDKKQDNIVKQLEKFNGDFSKMTGGVSSIVSGIQSMGVEIPKEIQNVIGVLSGVSSILSGITTLLALIQIDTKVTAATNTVKTVPVIGWALANGGIVPKAAGGRFIGGNSMSGDNIFAGNAWVNSGELVLNRAQQGVLADALGDGSTPNIKIDWVLKGDALYAVMNNNGRRTGRGEVVQRNRI